MAIKHEIYSHECTLLCDQLPPQPTLLLLLQGRSTLPGKAGLLPGSSSLPLKPNGLYRHCTDCTRNTRMGCAEETSRNRVSRCPIDRHENDELLSEFCRPPLDSRAPVVDTVETRPKRRSSIMLRSSRQFSFCSNPGVVRLLIHKLIASIKHICGCVALTPTYTSHSSSST